MFQSVVTMYQTRKQLLVESGALNRATLAPNLHAWGLGARNVV